MYVCRLSTSFKRACDISREITRSSRIARLRPKTLSGEKGIYCIRPHGMSQNTIAELRTLTPGVLSRVSVVNMDARIRH